MPNRVFNTIYNLKDGVTQGLRRIGSAFRDVGRDAEVAGAKTDASFTQRITARFKQFTTRVGRLRFALLGLSATIFGVVRGFAALTRAASIQEQAEARLENNLRKVVGARREEIEALKQQAAELQKTTRFGDEQTISAQALLATFRLTSSQIRQLTPRLQDMAEGLSKASGAQVDLETAATAVGKALTSGIGALSRYGVTLTDAQKETFKLGDRQEKVKVLVEALDGNFKGLAETIGDTFAGKVAKASNSAGDFLERIGKGITQNAGVHRLLEGFAAAFSDFANTVNTNGPVTSAVIGTVADAFRFAGNIIRAAWNNITFVVRTAQLGITKAAAGVTRALQAITFGELSKDLGLVADALDATAEKIQSEVVEDIEDLEKVNDALGQSFLDLLNPIEETTKQTEKKSEADKEAADQAAAHTREENEKAEALERTKKLLESLSVDAAAVNTKIRDSFRESTNELITLAKQGDQTGKVLKEALNNVFEEADTKEEIKLLGDAIKEAGENGKIAAEDYTTLINRFAALKGEAFEAKVAAEDAANELERGAKRSVPAVRELNKELEKTQEATESTGSNALAIQKNLEGLLRRYQSLSENIGKAAQEIIKKATVPGESVATFIRRVGKGLSELNFEIDRQAKRADELFQRLEKSADNFGGAALGARNALKLLDNQRLDRLNQSIREGTSRLRQLNEEARRGREQAELDLLRAQGLQEEAARRQREIEIEALEERAERLQRFGISEASREIQQTIVTKKRIAEIEEQARQEEAAKNELFRQQESRRDNSAAQQSERTFSREERNITVTIQTVYLLDSSPTSRQALAEFVEDVIDENNRLLN